MSSENYYRRGGVYTAPDFDSETILVLEVVHARGETSHVPMAETEDRNSFTEECIVLDQGEIYRAWLSPVLREEIV